MIEILRFIFRNKLDNMSIRDREREVFFYMFIFNKR